MRKAWYLVTIAFVAALTVGPMGAQVTFNLSTPGSGENLAGVYTSPYTGNINGGPTIPVICDDFADESYTPETWQAFVTQGSSISLASSTTDPTLKWTGASADGVNLTQAQAYTVASVLAVEILQNAAPSQATEEEELSYAMWALFDPTGTTGDPGAIVWLQAYASSYVNPVETLLDNAVTYTFNISHPSNIVLNSSNAAQVEADVNAMTIYSYDTAVQPQGACSPNCPAPQEFITVSMPEPSSPALLGIDLLGVGGLLLLLRGRRREREKAGRS